MNCPRGLTEQYMVIDFSPELHGPTWPGKHPATWAPISIRQHPLASLFFLWRKELRLWIVRARYIITGTNLLYAHGQIGTNQLRLSTRSESVNAVNIPLLGSNRHILFIFFSSLIPYYYKGGLSGGDIPNPYHSVVPWSLYPPMRILPGCGQRCYW